MANLVLTRVYWIKVLNEVKDALLKLERNDGYLNNVDSTIVILKDIIMGFGINGYATGMWLEDEDVSKLTPINSYIYISSFAFSK